MSSEEAPRISLQVSRGVVVASIQTDLEEAVLARFQGDVLERIHAVGARGLVLELSGLETLDPEEFEGLQRVIRMARVMGTDSVVVGLSAGVVSALITAGTEIGDLRATLDIDEALAMFDEPSVGRETSTETSCEPEVAAGDAADPEEEPAGAGGERG